MRRVFLWTGVVALAMFSNLNALQAEDSLGKASDNKIYAQSLVNEFARANVDVILIGLHVIPPGAKDEMMVACTHDLIGEKDDEADLAAVTGQQTVLAVSLKDPAKFKVYLPLKDAKGQSIGLMTLNFKNESGYDETHYCARALALRNGFARKIPSLEELFKPAS